MSEKTDVIIKSVDRMGKMPPTASKVLDICNTGAPSPKALTKVIMLDPVLTFEILKLVNSSFYGLANRVTSVQQAIVLLGATTVKNLCLGLALAGSVNKGSRPRNYFELGDFWWHTVAVGICCKLLAKEMGVSRAEADEMFLAGLLHDVGKAVTIRDFPEDYGKALLRSKRENLPLIDVEQEVFGITHSRVGEIMAERWSFPDWFVAGVSGHHQPDHGDEHIRRVQGVVLLSNLVCHRVGINRSRSAVGEYRDREEALADVLKVSDAFLGNGINERLPLEVERAASFVGLLANGKRGN